ncbi:MAG: InlB B-repeat-containing protein [Candidatus Saccharibacteria bacterium]|nr:InlB B-repeat-containing protein [Candidatus Saccharibacteria bacterium]
MKKSKITEKKVKLAKINYTPSKRQKQKVRFNKIYKLSQKVCAVAFVGLALIAASSLVNAFTAVDMANDDGIPSVWANNASTELNSALLSEQIANKIQYTTYLTNSNTKEKVLVKKFSVFIKDNNGENQGFLPFDNGKLEVSYTPNDLSSWQPVEITAPSTDSLGFVLNDIITLAPAGSDEYNTVYFRFYVEIPEEGADYLATSTFYATDEFDTAQVFLSKDNFVLGKGSVTEPEVPEEGVSVVFNSNGGSKVETVNIAKGETVAEPEKPARKGYVFLGWTLPGWGTENCKEDDACSDKFDFSTPITENLVLTAQWQRVVAAPSSANKVETPVPNVPATSYEEDNTIMYVPDLYVPVLGRTAFSSAMEFIFELATSIFGSRSFDSIILSQASVMIILALFAVSFATMCATHKYSDNGKFSPLKKLKELNLIEK